MSALQRAARGGAVLERVELFELDPRRDELVEIRRDDLPRLDRTVPADVSPPLRILSTRSFLIDITQSTGRLDCASRKQISTDNRIDGPHRRSES